MGADVGKRILVCAFRERARLAGPNRFASETETAIDRTDMNHLEQYPVGIAMNDAQYRRVHFIADRVRRLVGLRPQFFGARYILPRNRIVRIIRVDERGNLWRHSDGVARRDLFEIAQIGSRYQTMRGQFGRLAQRRDWLEIDALHVTPVAASTAPDRRMRRRLPASPADRTPAQRRLPAACRQVRR